MEEDKKKSLNFCSRIFRDFQLNRDLMLTDIRWEFLENFEAFPGNFGVFLKIFDIFLKNSEFSGKFTKNSKFSGKI